MFPVQNTSVNVLPVVDRCRLKSISDGFYSKSLIEEFLCVSIQAIENNIKVFYKAPN